MTGRPSRTLLFVLVLTFTLPVAAPVADEQPSRRQPRTLEALLAAYERTPRAALDKWRTVQALATGCATPLLAQYRQWLADKGIPQVEIDASELRDHEGSDPSQLRVASTENFVVHASKTTAISLAPDFVDRLTAELELAHDAFFDRYGFKRPMPGLKIRVFVGPGGSSAQNGHMHIGTGADIESTPAHELFHLSQQATWLIEHTTWFSESGAGWAEDIVSPAHDARNTYPRVLASDVFASWWTGPNLYSYAYFYKYLQQWTAALGGTDPGAFDFGVDLVRRLHDRFEASPGPTGHLKPAHWDAALAAEVSPDMTFDKMMKYFLIAAYTKDLDDPFANYPIPGAMAPYPLTTRWDFLEDEEPNEQGAGYPPLVLSQDGQTLRTTNALTFSNVNGGFLQMGHAEFIRMRLAPERPPFLGGIEPVVYFTPSATDPDRVAFAALVQYTHHAGGVYVRPVLHLDAASRHRIPVFDSQFPASDFTADYLVVVPFTNLPWDGAVRRFEFEVSFQKP